MKAALVEERISDEAKIVSWARIKQAGYSITDQSLAVGGMFLANIALARVQSKEEYGTFALSYSLYTFISGFHNALILEPYSVHGGGRYHDRFQAYSRHMSRNNVFFGGTLFLALSCTWLLFRHYESNVASKALFGLAVAAPFILTGVFVRRTLYLRRRADLAAKFSAVSFLSLVSLLMLLAKFGALTGFTTFLIAGLAWSIAGVLLVKELPGITRTAQFKEVTLGHRTEHWEYARWVLATTFVFQLTNQAYYWFVAGFISVKEVAELRAMYLLLAPVDQVLIAIDLLVLPLMAHRFATRQDKKLVSLWWSFGMMSVALTLAYAACMWIFGGRLMHFVYKSKFDDVSVLLVMFALLPVIMGIGNSLNVALKSMERPDSVFYAYLASGTTTAVVGLYFVRHLGLRGAVYGMLVSAGMYTIVMLTSLILAARSGRISLASACSEGVRIIT